MIIEVHGHQIEVDDSFASMSPDQQQSTLQDIDNQVGLHQQVQQEQEQASQPQPGQPTSAEQQLINAQQGAIAPYASAVGAVTSNPKTLLGGGAIAAGAYKANALANSYQASKAAEVQKSLLELQGKQLDNYQKALQLDEFNKSFGNMTNHAEQFRPNNIAPQPNTSIIDEGRRVAQAVQKTAASKISGIGTFLGKAALGAQIATGLMYTSPEEKAVLQEEENRKRAMGWQPADPLHGRFFSGYPNGQTQPTGPVSPYQQ
jgi:hypothetical protein